MELKRYLEIVAAHWLPFLIAFAVTAIATFALVLPQPPVYESEATFVVRPRFLGPDEALSAFDTLIRGVEINATYAAIARSDMVGERAKGDLDPGTSTSNLSVDAEIVTGTNLISITASGRDPKTVQAFADAVGSETIAYIQSLNDIYELEPLDSAPLPKSPAGPNKRLTIVLGLIFGAALGMGLAMLAEYLRSGKAKTSSPPKLASADEAEGPDTVDDVPNVHGEAFLSGRLKREIRRAKLTGHPFSLAVVDWHRAAVNGGSASRGPANPDQEQVTRALEGALGKKDVLARLADGRLAVLLPGKPIDDARVIALDLEDSIAIALGDAGKNGSRDGISSGVCEFRDPAFLGSPEATRVARRLTEGGAQGSARRKGRQPTWKKRA